VTTMRSAKKRSRFYCHRLRVFSDFSRDRRS